MSGWTEFDPTGNELPAAAGVYVIFLHGKVVYVGQSLNLRQRFSRGGGGHNIRHGYAKNIHTPWGDFENGGAGQSVTGKYRVPRRYGEHLMWEARLIMKLQPRFNQRGKSRWAA